MTSLLIVPRWGGDAHSDFYPWLRSSEAELGFDSSAVVELAPDKDSPEPAATARAVRDALSDATDVVVLAHSVGCQGVIRALANGVTNARVRAVLCVAGWFDIDEPWPTIEPWLRDHPDFGPARRAAERWHLLVSDNDPFTADHALTRAHYETRLGATATLVPGAKHFNREREQAVREALASLI